MSATTEQVITYLLVEDNDDHAALVEKCFQCKKLNSEIRRVKSGTDCLAYLDGEKPFSDRSQYPSPDVILLDIRLPGILDGLQTLKAIRADSRYTSLSVMILTSSECDLDISRAYKLGANGYITKSDNLGELSEKLIQLQHSFQTWVQLPGKKHESAHNFEVEMQKEPISPDTVELFEECDPNDVFDTIVSMYKRDRDETIELLKAMEQVNITYFADLTHRFCMEKRCLFAGGQDVDWVFIREVVMEKLPRYTSLHQMAGIVNGITAVLEGNHAARLDNSSWQLWQGFCQAYLNQETDLQAPQEETFGPLPWLAQRWKAIALGSLFGLFALMLWVIVRELGIIILELR